MDNSNATERMALLATVDPQIADNAAKTSDTVNMALWRRAIAILLLGAVDTTADFKLQACDNANGDNPVNITGKAITQLTSGDGNKQAIIEIRDDEMPADKTHIIAVATAGNGSTGCYMAVAILGLDPRYSPTSSSDLASVAEIVA